MKTKKANNPHRGDDFTSFLQEENILPEVQALALKRAVAIQLQQILDHKDVNKTQLAKRMNTSRASLNRILDPTNTSATLHTISRAASALGKKVEINFVSA
jgi:antitoxin HicB